MNVRLAAPPTVLASLLVLCPSTAALAGAPAGATIVASGACPEQRRVAPKPAIKPRPEIEPPRDRPPSSLPCCKGADCTCSGPPALAATPAEATRVPASRHS